MINEDAIERIVEDWNETTEYFGRIRWSLLPCVNTGCQRLKDPEEYNNAIRRIKELYSGEEKIEEGIEGINKKGNLQNASQQRIMKG